MTITVVNKRFYKDKGVYIGRPSILGNPFSESRYGREACIEKYKKLMNVHLKEKDHVYDFLVKLSETEDLVLICWCKPLPCHGDVIKEAIEKIRKENKDGTR